MSSSNLATKAHRCYSREDGWYEPCCAGSSPDCRPPSRARALDARADEPHCPAHAARLARASRADAETTAREGRRRQDHRQSRRGQRQGESLERAQTGAGARYLDPRTARGPARRVVPRLRPPRAAWADRRCLVTTNETENREMALVPLGEGESAAPSAALAAVYADVPEDVVALCE